MCMLPRYGRLGTRGYEGTRALTLALSPDSPQLPSPPEAAAGMKGTSMMTEGMCPAATREVALRCKQLAPEINEAFENFSRAVFVDGALPEKVKQLIAVAVAHVTQCPYCITGHTRLAHRKGATPEEVMEAIWVAAEMRAGGAYAHSTLALHALGDGATEPTAGSSSSANQTRGREES